MAQAKERIQSTLAFDQLFAMDILEKASLLVDFYFPQLRPALDEVVKANWECVEILLGRAIESPTYGEVSMASKTLGDRRVVIEKRILAERPTLTKTFTGKFRAWFED